MKARARVVAEADGRGGTRLAVLRSVAPLLLRPTPDGVYLVGGAAGPLGGDDVRLELEVGPGAALTIRASAASVAQRGPHGGRSVLAVDAVVADDARLEWLPEPAVAAAGCWHRVAATVALSPRASMAWRDEVSLGRHAEAPGRWASRLSVEVAGRALLRQELDVGCPSGGWAGPAVTGGGRSVGSVVVVEPGWSAKPPPSAVLSPRAAVLALAGPGVQVTAVADDAVELRRLLEQGLALVVSHDRSPVR